MWTLSHRPVLAVALTLAAAAPPQTDWQERGVRGTVYPQPADVLVDDVRVHLDETGGAEQRVLDLAACPAGFAAVWRDTRFGSLALVLGLLDADGERIDFEEAVSTQHTARQFDPAVAVGGDFTGAVAWFGTSIKSQSTMLRPFAGADGFVSVPIPVEDAAGDSGRDARGGGGRGSRRPGVGIDGAGRGLVAWVAGESLTAQRFRRGEPRRDGGFEPERDGSAFAIGDASNRPEGDPLVALRPDGAALVAWPTARGSALWSDARSGSRPRSTTLTDIGRIVADPGGDGWWIAARRKGVPVVARVDPDLDTEVVVQLPPDVARIDVAAVADRLALVVERDSAAEGARFELRWHARTGAPLAEPRPFAPATASDVRVTANDNVLVAAWTDTRLGDPDVYYRVFPTDPAAEAPGGDRRWNSDTASADQSDADLDAAGERGWIAWEDLRSGTSAVVARRLGPDGPEGDERLLSVGAEDARAPAVAARADGAALVVWKVGPPREQRLVARFLDARGGAPGELFALDGGHRTGGDWPPAVATLDDGGFAVLFARDGDRLGLVRVDADGATVGAVRELARERDAEPRYPDLTPLDDGRLLALWDVRTAGRPARLVGRFLGSDLKPTGSELAFEGSPEGTGDWDPVAAPGPDGGFLMAWTGNDGPTRDVVARAFDDRGRPAGPPLGISVRATEQDFAEVERLPDGSWVVIWEDDISGYDHVLARRVSPDFDLGPRVTLNQRETDFVEARSGPTIAILGGALIGAWTDRRRSRGLDVYLRRIGPGFDRVTPAQVPGDRGR